MSSREWTRDCCPGRHSGFLGRHRDCGVSLCGARRDEQWALWIPQEVVIHCSTEMEDGLVFMLENPTDGTSLPPTRSPLMSSI